VKVGDLVEYTFKEIVSIGVVLDICPGPHTVEVLWDDGAVELFDSRITKVISESR
jgi:hypothetical protein